VSIQPGLHRMTNMHHTSLMFSRASSMTVSSPRLNHGVFMIVLPSRAAVMTTMALTLGPHRGRLVAR
jgi:hypothetical protein